MEALLTSLSLSSHLSHIIFSYFEESKKFVFTYCNLQGIIFYTFVKFLALLWSSLAAASSLTHCCICTKLNNKFSRKCGYPTIHSSSKTSQLNGIQSENFYEMDKFWHLMVCMIDPWGRLIHIIFKVEDFCSNHPRLSKTDEFHVRIDFCVSWLSRRIHFISVSWHHLHN